jgi:hypothetical protein
VVEGARLESVYTRKGIAGSNPALSASLNKRARSFAAGFLFAAAGRIGYSLFKLFTGLLNAAFIDWKLIVIKAIKMAVSPA